MLPVVADDESALAEESSRAGAVLLLLPLPRPPRAPPRRPRRRTSATGRCAASMLGAAMRGHSTAHAPAGSGAPGAAAAGSAAAPQHASARPQTARRGRVQSAPVLIAARAPVGCRALLRLLRGSRPHCGFGGRSKSTRSSSWCPGAGPSRRPRLGPAFCCSCCCRRPLTRLPRRRASLACAAPPQPRSVQCESGVRACSPAVLVLASERASEHTRTLPALQKYSCAFLLCHSPALVRCVICRRACW